MQIQVLKVLSLCDDSVRASLRGREVVGILGTIERDPGSGEPVQVLAGRGPLISSSCALALQVGYLPFTFPAPSFFIPRTLSGVLTSLSTLAILACRCMCLLLVRPSTFTLPVFLVGYPCSVDVRRTPEEEAAVQ